MYIYFQNPEKKKETVIFNIILYTSAKLYNYDILLWNEKKIVLRNILLEARVSCEIEAKIFFFINDVRDAKDI